MTITLLVLSAVFASPPASPPPQAPRPPQAPPVRAEASPAKPAPAKSTPARVSAKSPPPPKYPPVRAAEPDPEYAAAEAAVRSGKRVTLFVGVPAVEYSSPAVAVFRVDSLPAREPGVYDCFVKDGQPVMDLRTGTTPPLNRTAATTTVSGYGPAAPAAFTAPAPTVFLPRGTANCPNGQCPTPAKYRVR